MAFKPQTKSFLSYLKANKATRDRIRAPHDKTLLYAGNFFKPIWREIETEKRMNPQLAVLRTLPEVLSLLPSPQPASPSLKAYVEALTDTVPWQPDGFTIWRALSGIFASNATGRVSFKIGSEISGEKVFAVTELPVLMRNKNLDPITQELITYFDRCIKSRQAYINFGFIAG